MKRSLYAAILPLLFAMFTLAMPSQALGQTNNKFTYTNLVGNAQLVPGGYGCTGDSYKGLVPSFGGATGTRVEASGCVGSDFGVEYFTTPVAVPKTASGQPQPIIFNHAYRAMGRSEVTIWYQMSDGSNKYETVGADPSFNWRWHIMKSTPPAGAVAFSVYHASKELGGWVEGSHYLVTPDRFPKGIVSLRFDDSWKSQMTAARYLHQLGIQATFYIIYDLLDTPEHPDPARMSPDDVRELLALGHKVGSHTNTHPDLPTINGFQQLDEIQGSQQNIRRDFGYEVASTFAVPYGDYDATLLKLMMQYYDGITTSNPGFDGPGDNPQELHSMAIDNEAATTLAVVNGWADTAAENGQSLTVLFHQIPGPGEEDSQYAMRLRDFKRFARHVAQLRDQGKILVMPIEDLIQNMLKRK